MKTWLLIVYLAGVPTYYGPFASPTICELYRQQTENALGVCVLNKQDQ